MIPILYDHDEVDFSSQGLYRLSDAISCIVTEENNGIYECELKYPIDGAHFDEIFEGRIIGATHDDHGDIQPYEIYKYSAPLNGVVTFYAHHISYRLRNYILLPFHASSCAEAMTMLPAHSMNRCPFTFWTDNNAIADFDVHYPVSIKSILAGDGDTILNTYGYGEFEFDKWTVKFHTQRGTDQGVQIRYGKNLTDIKREYDSSEVYTAVVPYWYKVDNDGVEHLVTLSGYGVIVYDDDAIRYVYWTDEHGEIIRDEYDHPIELAPANMIYQPLDLTSYFDEEPTEEELALAARAYFEVNQPWIPEDNISVSFVELWQTPEYQNIAPLERVLLGDIVHVIHTKLGISILAKVIKTVYNTLLDRYDSVELGTTSPSLASAILGDTTSHIEKIEAQLRQSATAAYVNEQISAATDTITGGLGGYIKLTMNADNEPQEILIMDKPNVAQAQNVIRINKNGIGFSEHGYMGPFNSAWLIDGTFDAQVINVVNLAATVIRTGFLTDAQGYNYWNLETGEFRLSSTSMIDTYQETSYVATRNYKIGDKIEVKLDNDTLIYEATKVIPKGSVLQPGNNIKAATAHTLLDYARKSDAIKEVDVEYASHTSSTDPPAQDSSAWQTESPQWESGKYIWQRTKMIDGNNAIAYSDPVCIQGAVGPSGPKSAIVQLYQRAPNPPAKPNVQTVYNFSSNTLDPIPTGWSREYVTKKAQNHTATHHLYKQSSSQPTIDWSENLTFDFTTNKLTSVPSGWSEELPTGSGKIWVTAATVLGTTDTVKVAKAQWTTPVSLTNHTLTYSSAGVFLYARAETASALTKPTQSLDYTFATGRLSRGGQSSGILGQWSQEIPENNGLPCFEIHATASSADGQTTTIPAAKWSSIAAFTPDDEMTQEEDEGDPLYVTAATASSTEETDTIGMNEWSDPVPLVKSGLNCATVFLYARADTVSSLSKPNVTLTYKFSDGKLYRNNQIWTSAVWSQEMPDSSDGKPCFLIQATAVSSYDADDILKTEWSDISELVADGDEGPGVQDIQEQYCLSTSKTTAPVTGWGAEQPAWKEGQYIWTRSKVTWTDIDEQTGTNRITYTTPVLANAINGANEAVAQLDDSLNQDEVFRRLTNNFNTEGIFLENGRLFINSTGIATGFIHDKSSTGSGTIEFYNEPTQIASRDYVANKYIAAGDSSTPVRTTTNIYKGEMINNKSNKVIDRLGTLYSESGNKATRAYVANDYITFGGKLYQAVTSIAINQKFSTSGSKNVNLLGTLYSEETFLATRAYSANNYIGINGNLYQALSAIESNTSLYPGANCVVLQLDTLYRNYWNLNTGFFQTKNGRIGDFAIGNFATTDGSGASFSGLAYLYQHNGTNYDFAYPYRAVNTPNPGVMLCGGSGDSDAGYTVLSQGRMFVSGATNFAGRFRINAGMLYFDLGLDPSNKSSPWTVMASINPWTGTGGHGININGNLAVTGDLACTGSKPRIVDTEDYGWRYLYAYENPTPMFGDVGEGEIGEDGLCYIWLESIFAKTIEDGQYQVFLQQYNDGKCFVKNRASGYFIVQGTPGLTFGWELKAKQKGYGMTRLRNEVKNFGILQPAMPENQDNFADSANTYLQNLREGRVTQ